MQGMASWFAVWCPGKLPGVILPVSSTLSVEGRTGLKNSFLPLPNPPPGLLSHLLLSITHFSLEKKPWQISRQYLLTPGTLYLFALDFISCWQFNPLRCLIFLLLNNWLILLVLLLLSACQHELCFQAKACNSELSLEIVSVPPSAKSVVLKLRYRYHRRYMTCSLVVQQITQEIFAENQNNEKLWKLSLWQIIHSGFGKERFSLFCWIQPNLSVLQYVLYVAVSTFL